MKNINKIVLATLFISSRILSEEPAAKACETIPQQINEKRISNFAVIYRIYLKPNRETEYQKAWQSVAQYFVKYRGAIGSCLHCSSEGMWIAYSRWPDQKTRDASWPGENAPSEELPQEIREAVLTMKDCVDQDRKLPEIRMEVVNDLLLKNKNFD